MYRVGFILWSSLLLACNGKENTTKEDQKENGYTHSGFSQQFKEVTPPYQLTDTGLLRHQDTTTIPASFLSPFIPDSISRSIFGKTGKIKFTPLAKMTQGEKETYYIVGAAAGNKKAALLMVFDKDHNHGATLPFLVPDNQTATQQTSTIDKSFAITKTVVQRSGIEITGEGKEVLAYDANEKKFSLVMLDLLDDQEAEPVNPIDTFPAKNKWAGEYYQNKRSFIAVRDGRHPNQLLVYIHTENKSGDCKGEMKGEFIMTSSNTAAYQQGGDPCVLELAFSGNRVSMNESRGCGNYRGLDCPFAGSFTKKKEQKPKESPKPKKSK